jgi:hypothetical protein
MIVHAVAALEEDAIRAEVHQSLRHLIVDEYQDISPAQEALIESLISGSAHPVCCRRRPAGDRLVAASIHAVQRPGVDQSFFPLWPATLTVVRSRASSGDWQRPGVRLAARFRISSFSLHGFARVAVGGPARRLAMLAASSLLPAATRSSDHSRHTAAASRSMLEAVRASMARSKL